MQHQTQTISIIVISEWYNKYRTLILVAMSQYMASTVGVI